MWLASQPSSSHWNHHWFWYLLLNRLLRKYQRGLSTRTGSRERIGFMCTDSKAIVMLHKGKTILMPPPSPPTVTTEGSIPSFIGGSSLIWQLCSKRACLSGPFQDMPVAGWLRSHRLGSWHCSWFPSPACPWLHEHQLSMQQNCKAHHRAVHLKVIPKKEIRLPR